MLNGLSETANRYALQVTAVSDVPKNNFYTLFLPELLDF